jgi:hypothetical protein
MSPGPAARERNIIFLFLSVAIVVIVVVVAVVVADVVGAVTPGFYSMTCIAARRY